MRVVSGWKRGEGRGKEEKEMSRKGVRKRKGGEGRGRERDGMGK